MNAPLFQLLLLTANAIQGSSIADLRAIKGHILYAYKSIRRPCNIITLFSGVIILFTVSPVAPDLLEAPAYSTFVPIFSFLSFLAINCTFLVKWRLSTNHQRIVSAIQEKSQNNPQTSEHQSVLHITQLVD